MFNNIGNTGTASTAKVGIQAADSVGVFYTLGSYPAANTPAAGTGVKFKPGTATDVEVFTITPETCASAELSEPVQPCYDDQLSAGPQG
jgi:hypothetical protein